MKLTFKKIENGIIFEKEFHHMIDNNSIKFKRMQSVGGLAVVYAPNGTGKSS